jgi:glycosyltransferase involved in cell wall biosynthesis
MIDAMAMLSGRSDARLLILGQGEREPALRALVHERGLGETVQFGGFQQNPWKFIARATVFLLTSRYEGFGNVLVEAMACGVPVVATASAGTRDIVRHGVDGVLVEAHTPAAVADALLRIVSDASLRQRMAADARAGAERFSVLKIAAQYDDTLRRLIA